MEKVGGEAHATNNMMELRASIEALKILPEGAKGILRSDSRYIVDGVNVHRKLWEQRGWRNSTGKPVKNAELWVELFADTQAKQDRCQLCRRPAGNVNAARTALRSELQTSPVNRREPLTVAALSFAWIPPFGGSGEGIMTWLRKRRLRTRSTRR